MASKSMKKFMVSMDLGVDPKDRDLKRMIVGKDGAAVAVAAVRWAHGFFLFFFCCCCFRFTLGWSALLSSPLVCLALL